MIARHIAGVATVVLVVLKLAEVGTVAAWSWWAVLFGPTLVVTGLILGDRCNSFVMRENFRLQDLARRLEQE